MTEPVDVVLVGGGIMSATLATLLSELAARLEDPVYERLDGSPRRARTPWNNAGTGHAALCELNYTPERPDGTVDIAKAVAINEQFELSRELWAHLVERACCPSRTTFITTTPHMTFVRGASNV